MQPRVARVGARNLSDLMVAAGAKQEEGISGGGGSFVYSIYNSLFGASTSGDGATPEAAAAAKMEFYHDIGNSMPRLRCDVLLSGGKAQANTIRNDDCLFHCLA